MKTLILVMFFALAACSKSGSPGADGMRIVKNEVIAGVAQDFCDRYVDQTCLFIGGQRVTFSDGTQWLTINTLMLSLPDSDSDTNSTQFFIPATGDEYYIIASRLFSRGAGTFPMYVVFTRLDDKLSLVYDTSGNGLDIEDEILVNSLTLTSL